MSKLGCFVSCVRSLLPTNCSLLTKLQFWVPALFSESEILTLTCSHESGMKAVTSVTSEGCQHSQLLKGLEVCVIVWLWLNQSMSIPLWSVDVAYPIWAPCQTSRFTANGGWWTECFPFQERDTFRYSFDVTNCIFDSQAHPNDKHLLLQNSLWYLSGKQTNATAARRLVTSQARELDWYHFV